MPKPKKFLIAQFAAFGDCLYATTIAKQIKHDFPNSHITWAISDKYKSILDLNPHVDDIWMIPRADILGHDWLDFEKEALQKKKEGVYDEIIFSQVGGFNYHRYDGTIRSTTLNAYKGKITVDVAPVVKLSEKEIENVKKFAQENNLSSFNHVILFECSPTSYQSKMNFDTALEISKKITSKRKDVCFVLSTLNDLQESNPQIISAKNLTFRENAELTKYCTMLLGCSSGITWLSTSEAAKILPMIQILDGDFAIFAGVKHDFELWNVKNRGVIELLNPNEERLISCIMSYFEDGFETAKSKYDQRYVPSLKHFYYVRYHLLKRNKGVLGIYRFCSNFYKKNPSISFWRILSVGYKHELMSKIKILTKH